MDSEDLVTIPLLGRQMQFHRMTPGQQVMMARIGTRAQRQGQDAHNHTTVMMKLMDVIDSLFTLESDREDVEAAVLRRELDLDDLMTIALGGRRPEPVPDDDADPVMPKMLRDKKPAAVAKASKKTANPRRASR